MSEAVAWAASEDEILRSRYGELSADELSALLGRSTGAIRKRLGRLGIRSGIGSRNARSDNRDWRPAAPKANPWDKLTIRWAEENPGHPEARIILAIARPDLNREVEPA